jgi:hypothetical protein
VGVLTFQTTVSNPAGQKTTVFRGRSVSVISFEKTDKAEMVFPIPTASQSMKPRSFLGVGEMVNPGSSICPR